MHSFRGIFGNEHKQYATIDNVHNYRLGSYLYFWVKICSTIITKKITKSGLEPMTYG